jgi:hypothetical protein
MDTQLKAKWTAALRSGEYEQATRTLQTKSGGAFCCLGVLNDILGAQQDYSVPDKLLGDFWTLADMNDGNNCERHTFAQIADYIDANY